MENKQPNIGQAGPSPANSEPPVQQPNEPVFYNVMPKIKSYSGIVEPVLKLNGLENPGLVASSPNSTFKKYKFYIIMGILLLIGAPVVYYIATSVLNKPIEQETFLINNPNPPNQNEPQSNNQFTTPTDWQGKYFPQCEDVNLCGDEADPDRDGLNNLQEYNQGTDPNNPDSDQDGLADGDEINVFGSNPLNAHTSGSQDYTDKDYIIGGYSFVDDKPMSAEQIDSLSKKMKEQDLHPPTITSLGDVLLDVYKFDGTDTNNASSTPSTATTSPTSDLDQSLEAKQDRDAQRSNTIKSLGLTLLDYRQDNNIFPKTNSFAELSKSIKPYLKVAANFVDPINQDPFVYTYAVNEKGDDFTLSFYSEVANSIIKKHAADAQKDHLTSEAAMFDDQRKTDLESMRIALLLYSNNNAAGNQEYVFPTPDKYKTAIVPSYIGSIPKDPKTKLDYEYQVSETFDTFTLKAPLDSPKPGISGYLCNQEECREY